MYLRVEADRSGSFAKGVMQNLIHSLFTQERYQARVPADKGAYSLPIDAPRLRRRILAQAMLYKTDIDPTYGVQILLLDPQLLSNLFTRLDRHLVERVHDEMISHIFGRRFEAGFVGPCDLGLDGSSARFRRALFRLTTG